MKYLIVGLGNIGTTYQNTRHNVGFTVLDAFAEASNTFFTDSRYGSITTVKVKNKSLLLLKPSTLMNLSGNAVRYWMQQEKIPLQRTLIIVDDIALPLGTLRLKPKGADAGHNGLKNIQEILGTNQYSRLRFGIGNDFPRGGQIDFVLGQWKEEELQIVQQRSQQAIEIIKSFCLAGVQITMNQFNNK